MEFLTVCSSVFMFLLFKLLSTSGVPKSEINAGASFCQKNILIKLFEEIAGGRLRQRVRRHSR